MGKVPAKIIALSLSVMTSLVLVSCSTDGTPTNTDGESSAAVGEATSSQTEGSESSETINATDGVKEVEKVRVDFSELEPVTLDNGTGIYTVQELTDYVTEFFNLLRAGDEAAFSYLVHNDSINDETKRITDEILPSALADEEAREVALEFFNRVELEAPGYDIYDSEKTIDTNSGAIQLNFPVHGLDGRMYTSVLTPEETQELIAPIIGTTESTNYEEWSAVYDYIINKINENDLKRNITGLPISLVSNGDGSVSIDATSLRGLIDFGIPLKYNDNDQLIWDYSSLLELPYMDEFQASWIYMHPDDFEDTEIGDMLNAYNSGEYESLFNRLSETVETTVDSDGVPENLIDAKAYYDTVGVYPQLHTYYLEDDSRVLLRIYGSQPSIINYESIDAGFPVSYMGVGNVFKTISFEDEADFNENVLNELQGTLFSEILEPYVWDSYREGGYTTEYPVDYYK